MSPVAGKPALPSEFVRRVFNAVSRIPAGRVATYGDIAALAGRPRSARAVGRIMSSARRPGLPYHRVVAAGGVLGGFGGRPAVKVSLLAAEGLVIRRGRVAEFARHRWTGRKATRPPTTSD